MIKPKIYKAKLKDRDYEVKGVYYSFPETTYCFKEDYENNPRHVIVTHEMTDWGLPNQLRVFEIDPDTLKEVEE